MTEIKQCGTKKIAAVTAAALAFSIAGATTALAGGLDYAVAYQVSTAHDGVQTDSALAPPYSPLWQVTLPGSVSYPIIVQGKVYVTTSTGPTGDPTLYALSQQTGATLWSQPLADPSGFAYPKANAAYDGGKIFAVTSSGFMSAFDATTGALNWTSQMPYQYMFTSPPTAANGVVYTNGAGGGGTIYAVSESSGAVLATNFVQNGDDSSPVVTPSAIYSSFACNQDYAFSPSTLAPIWYHNSSCEGGGGRTAVYTNGKLLTRDWAFTGNLILDATNGQQLGTYGPANIYQDPYAPAARGNNLWYVSNGALSAQSISNPANVVDLWSFAGDGQIDTAPILISTPSGSYVIVGSSSGALYAVNPSTGAQVWTDNLGTSISPPDEQNVSGPLTGLGAGQGLLVVPAGNTVTAFTGTGAPSMPTSKSQCLKDGWKTFGVFKNQGQCIAYVVSHHHH